MPQQNRLVPFSCLRVPFWRCASVVATCALGVAAIEAGVAGAVLAWTLVWPAAAALVLAEAVLLVYLMYDDTVGAEGGRLTPLLPPYVTGRSDRDRSDRGDRSDVVAQHIGGVGGLLRLLDIWLAWALIVGCCLVLFHLHAASSGSTDAVAARSLFDSRSDSRSDERSALHVHFRGFETLAASASVWEALTYFVPLSLNIATSMGLIVLEPTSALSRLLLTLLGVVAFLFQVTIVFTGTAEALARRRAWGPGRAPISDL